MDEAHEDPLQIGCERLVQLEFRGAGVSSEAGLFAFRDEATKLTKLSSITGRMEEQILAVFALWWPMPEHTM